MDEEEELYEITSVSSLAESLWILYEEPRYRVALEDTAVQKHF
jgi:hypothetical protein